MSALRLVRHYVHIIFFFAHIASLLLSRYRSKVISQVTRAFVGWPALNGIHNVIWLVAKGCKNVDFFFFLLLKFQLDGRKQYQSHQTNSY